MISASPSQNGSLSGNTPSYLGASPIVRVSLSEVLAAMSRALDLTEGKSVGHTVRTTLIGMRIAEELDLSAFDRVALYGALLLKDSGSSGQPSVAEVVNADVNHSNGQRIVELPSRAINAFKSVREGSLRKVGSLLRRSAKPSSTMPQLLSRAERGSSIALRIGFSTATADGIRHIDEHWDGSGIPDKLIGHEIPIFSRIILLAQTLDAYYTQRGLLAAMKMAREKSGQWFDPSLVRIARSFREDLDWWESL
ncbi:MAG TPA: HD domain-containing phosphohydrolase, partial [Gemmatimonadaceae bacterium]|nr:HD domain-containing phosphohydrolase [Gemmatimonadaceae bacterium]